MVKAAPVQIIAEHVQGDVFAVIAEPTEKHVLWGELFKEKERNFLRKELKSEMVSFSIGDTYQMALRSVWQPRVAGTATGAQTDATATATATTSLSRRLSQRQVGRHILFLHSLSGQLTSSWTWSKFIQPLYDRGFSVILLDLPGFGRSGVGTCRTLDPSVWLAHDWHIAFKVMEMLGVAKVHLAAYGETCGTVLRMLQQEPNLLQKEHFFFNPIVNLDVLFPQRRMPGAGDQRLATRKAQQAGLSALIRSVGTRLWVAFDRFAASSGVLKENLETFTSAASHAYTDKLSVITMTDHHLCEARAGARVPVFLLFPSRCFVDTFCDFMAGGHLPTQETLPEFEDRPGSANSDEALAAAARERVRRARGLASNMEGWNRAAIGEALSMLNEMPEHSQVTAAQQAIARITRRNPDADATSLPPARGSTPLPGQLAIKSTSPPGSAGTGGLPLLLRSATARSAVQASSIETSVSLVMQTRPNDPTSMRDRLLSNMGRLRRSLTQNMLMLTTEQVVNDFDAGPDEQIMIDRAIEESLETFMEDQQRRGHQKLVLKERDAERKAGLRHRKSFWETQVK